MLPLPCDATAPAPPAAAAIKLSAKNAFFTTIATSLRHRRDERRRKGREGARRQGAVTVLPWMEVRAEVSERVAQQQPNKAGLAIELREQTSHRSQGVLSILRSEELS